VISGATRVAAVIGDPVSHSLSPALHNAAFATLGLDWVYVALEVAAGDAGAAVDAMCALHLGGLSVTMPHKDAVADHLARTGRLDPAAASLHSVNTVVRAPDGVLEGHSTDGAGFVASLRAAGIDPTGRAVLLVGAGGAARAIADALGRSGASAVLVANRTRAAAEAAAALAGTVGRVVDSSDEGIAAADIVVNATSVGMGVHEHSSDALPIDPRHLGPHHVVADIVYHPRDTALLRAARAAGARTVDGLGMLVHQAALQQQLWHGALPDVGAMAAAAERELAARRQ
jgi:shikimate dehydrogenase